MVIVVISTGAHQVVIDTDQIGFEAGQQVVIGRDKRAEGVVSDNGIGQADTQAGVLARRQTTTRVGPRHRRRHRVRTGKAGAVLLRLQTQRGNAGRARVRTAMMIHGIRIGGRSVGTCGSSLDARGAGQRRTHAPA